MDKDYTEPFVVSLYPQTDIVLYARWIEQGTFEQDFELADVVLQEGETCDKRLSTPGEILEGLSDGTIVPFQYAKKWMEELL